MPRFLLVILLLAVGALVAAGCGDDEPAADGRELLATAFETPLESGRLSLSADVQVEGVPFLADGLDVRVEGPFTQKEADLDVTLGGLGPGFGGGLAITQDNVFVTVAGQAYELGEQKLRELKGRFEHETGGDAEAHSLADLGIDVQRWFTDPRVEGEEEVAGEPVTKVVTGIDASAVLSDVAALTPVPEEDAEQLGRLLEDGRAEIYVSRDDDTVRRMVLDLEFEVPEAARGRLFGAEGGAAKLDVTFTDVGEPQSIEAPADARPLAELFERFGLFGLGLELLRR